jgi:CMP/dCMP kinase
MIITISGSAGSGKSTVAKYIADKLDLTHYSNGDLMRQMAKEKGVSILELNKLSENDKTIDKELDERQIRLGKDDDNFVIDSRLGFHFIPNSFKVFLKADLRVRAERIFGDQRSEEHNTDVMHTIENIEKRQESEKLRYKELYNVDYTDEANFDLIVNTTDKTIDEVGEEVLKAVKKN